MCHNLDKPLDLFLLRSLPASTMLQNSSVDITAVTLLWGDWLNYKDYSTTRGSYYGNRRLIDKLMLTSQKLGRLRLGNPISHHYTVTSIKAFINKA